MIISKAAKEAIRVIDATIAALQAHLGVMIIVVVDEGLEISDFDWLASTLTLKKRVQLKLRHSGFREASVASVTGA